MITLKDVSFSYDKTTPVLNALSFHIGEGESVGLIGANGAGKSTLMKAMLGIVQAQGMIQIDGMDVNKKNLADVRKCIGYVLQNSDHQMFMPTVYDDMMFGLLNYGMAKAEAEKKCDAVLERLEIGYLKNKYNHQISGGEKRMSAIAVVLAMEPKVLLMDEPTTALDPHNRRIVINAVKDIALTKIIASHDLDMILDTCDRVILLGQGTIIADGKPEEILKNKELLEENHLELPLRYYDAFR